MATAVLLKEANAEADLELDRQRLEMNFSSLSDIQQGLEGHVWPSGEARQQWERRRKADVAGISGRDAGAEPQNRPRLRGRSAKARVPGELLSTSRRSSASRRRQFARTRAAVTARRRGDLRSLASSSHASTAPSAEMLALQDTPEAADSRVLAKLWHKLRTARERVNNRSVPVAITDTVRFFLAALGDTCILAKDQEALLARIWRGRLRVEAARAELAAESPPNAPPASREAVAARLGLRSVGHLALLEANCQAARELFLQHNLRLVFSVAKTYVGRGMELQELMQEGIVGLERAISKFDPARGFKFSTYAHWWIRQAIARSLNEQTRIVRLPVHISDAVSKIMRAQDELGVSTSAADAAAADEAVVGEHLGLAPAKVAAYLRASRPHRSLDAPTTRLEGSGNRPTAPGDVLPCAACDEPGHLQDEAEGAALLRADLNAMLGTLQPRERNVLRLRYGLHRADGCAMSNAEISAAYGISRERIRQIEDAAFAKLRGPLRRSMLRVGLYFRHPPMPAPGPLGPLSGQELAEQPGLEAFAAQPRAELAEQMSAAWL